jgi:hypothetical protein
MCINDQTDNDNCGACGNVCSRSIGQVCQEGQCQCENGGIVCNGACIIAQIDGRPAPTGKGSCGKCNDGTNGVYGPPVSYPAGQGPSGIAVGDLNGDGKLDLAVSNNSGNNVSVLLNQGTGTFASPANYPAGMNPNSIAMGDLNGDGKPDLVVANDADTVNALLNRGDGTFGGAMSFPAGVSPNSVVLGDLDKDGKLDLAVANTNGANPINGTSLVSVLLGHGDGTFAAPVAYGSIGGGDFNGKSLAIGDVNGDALLDLVVGAQFGFNPAHFVLVALLGKGDGTVQQGGGILGSVGGPLGYLVSPATSIAIGDFDGDGNADVAATVSGRAGATVGHGPMFTNVEGCGDGSNSTAIAIGDLDGDGPMNDIAVANQGSNDVSVVHNCAGSGTYAAGTAPTSVAVGDFDGDGQTDIAVANGGSNDVSVLLRTCNPGKPTCSAAQAYCAASDRCVTNCAQGCPGETVTCPGNGMAGLCVKDCGAECAAARFECESTSTCSSTCADCDLKFACTDTQNRCVQKCNPDCPGGPFFECLDTTSNNSGACVTQCSQCSTMTHGCGGSLTSDGFCISSCSLCMGTCM